MSLELVKKDYTYQASLGPLSVKCHSDLSKDLSRLDQVISCLKKPNTQPTSLVGSIGRQVDEGKLVFVRLYNFLRTGVWMNEAGARKIVKLYAKLENKQKTEEQTEKVKVIYDRLAQIKRGEGTYADGIIKASIDPRKSITVGKTIEVFKEIAIKIAKDKHVHQALAAIGETALNAIVLIAQAYIQNKTHSTVKSLQIPPKNKMITI